MCPKFPLDHFYFWIIVISPKVKKIFGCTDPLPKSTCFWGGSGLESKDFGVRLEPKMLIPLQNVWFYLCFHEGLPCCLKITPLLTSDIFSKNHDRNIIFLQKGVKCYRWAFPNRFRTVLDNSGHPRPNFNFFSVSKKWFLGGLQMLKILILEALSTIFSKHY